MSGLVTIAGGAAAQTEPEATWDGGYDVRNVRRSDLAVGVSLGWVVGNTTGTLNETEQLNDDSYRRSTEAAVGGGATVWLGGALRDWFSVGVGAAFAGEAGHGLFVDQEAFHLRFDLYPLYSLGRGFRDLGVAADFGLGLLRGIDQEAHDTAIEGGSLSSIGTGVFWEGLRLSRGCGSGPLLHFWHLDSLAATSNTVLLGFRVTAYSGPRRRRAREAALVRRPMTDHATATTGGLEGSTVSTNQQPRWAPSCTCSTTPYRSSFLPWVGYSR
ncbi:MAG: hypothetical protein JW751_17340 [Polyangiaceae bacterium]|nr:hypothetical protein [Polyangiaceae bacterium]